MMESKSTSCWSAIVYPHLPGKRRATLYVVVVDARQSKGGWVGSPSGEVAMKPELEMMHFLGCTRHGQGQ